MIKTVFTYLLLLTFSLNAQMVVNPVDTDFEHHLYFNAEFIASKNLKNFSGSYSTKFDMDIIRPSNDSYFYEFNRLGRLVRQYKILIGDTLITTYQYDYIGNIVLLRESNRLGYYENRYEYDKQNRLVKNELRRDKTNEHNKFSFELDESMTVSVETYEYIQLEGIDYKRICYNSSKRISRIEFFYFNSKGQLAKRESALHNGTARTETNYFYNSDNQIEEIKTLGVGSGTHSNKKIFEYDHDGNVLAKKEYRGDKLISEEQLLFNEGTGILSAIIARGEAGNMLTILKFNTVRFF